MQHVQQAPPSLRERNISISPAVEAVALHALAKQRNERPATAADLARELSAAVSGTPLSPRTGTASLSSSSSIPITPTPPASGSNSGQMRTEVMPIAGPHSGGVTPAGMPSYLSGGQIATPARRKLTPTLIAAAIALVLLVGAATVFLLQRNAGEAVKEDKKTSHIPQAPPGMAYVAGGEMMMGSEGGDEYERPKHKVTVKPFFIDLTEVTCEDYEKFIRATGHQAPPAWTNGQMPAGTARRPVTGVDWDDATAYATWAGKRLPTEQEWEFAARGTDERLYPWGNEWKTGYANAGETTLQHLADVGAHAAGASPCGALDMIGNAWEWTASDLVAYPGGQLPADRPAGELKVIRGNYWGGNQNRATTTFRRGWPARGGNEYDNTGFRCARDITVTATSQVAAPTAKPITPEQSWPQFYETFGAAISGRDRTALTDMLAAPFAEQLQAR